MHRLRCVRWCNPSSPRGFAHGGCAADKLGVRRATRRIGEKPLTSIDTDLTDDLYEKLLV